MPTPAQNHKIVKKRTKRFKRPQSDRIRKVDVSCPHCCRRRMCPLLSSQRHTVTHGQRLARRSWPARWSRACLSICMHTSACWCWYSHVHAHLHQTSVTWGVSACVCVRGAAGGGGGRAPPRPEQGQAGGAWVAQVQGPPFGERFLVPRVCLFVCYTLIDARSPSDAVESRLQSNHDELTRLSHRSPATPHSTRGADQGVSTAHTAGGSRVMDTWCRSVSGQTRRPST
jgi:hypothetical protein